MVMLVIPRDITSENTDDGNMNFDGGEIFDQLQECIQKLQVRQTQV